VGGKKSKGKPKYRGKGKKFVFFALPGKRPYRKSYGRKGGGVHGLGKNKRPELTRSRLGKGGGEGGTIMLYRITRWLPN